jgi:hypothetical protein
MSSLEKCLFKHEPFKIGLLCAIELYYDFYILDTNFMSDQGFAHIFSHSQGSFSLSIDCFPAGQKLFGLM